MKKIFLGICSLSLVLFGCGNETENNTSEQVVNTSEKTNKEDIIYESETGEYTVLIPENAEIIEENADVLQFGEESTEENYTYSIELKYENKSSTDSIDTKLTSITDKFLLDSESFEKYTNNNNDVYTLVAVQDYDGMEDLYDFYFINYVKSNNSDQAISIVYNARCLTKDEFCKIGLISEQERSRKIINSIKFK